MAIQTPPHAQRFRLINTLHLVDSAMAFNTTHPMRHVGLMAEINVLGKIVNLDPLHRLARRPAIPDRLPDYRSPFGYSYGNSCTFPSVESTRNWLSPPSCGNTGNQYPASPRASAWLYGTG